ncbi:PP2C family protein-serine/threonine phosphatase [Aeoliella sp.]|uniref:PP2C family protein-serine/threonine phosphatase n=1 Tax=Aeoliella sp. TaxID=2795800 RepID=UPI003CCB82E3
MTDNATRKHRSTHSTVTLLLLAVNLPLVLLVGLLLAWDYHREIRRAIDVRRVTLTDEASVIGNALLRLSEPDDIAAISAFLERSCAETADPETPRHWIDVRWKGKLIHAHSGPQGAPLNRQTGDTIVGRFTDDDLNVEVIERAVEIRRSARGEMLVHLSGIAALATLAALIVDIVLVMLIANPTRRLIAVVENIQSGQFELQPQSFTSRELNDLSSGIVEMAEALRSAQVNRTLAMSRARNIQNHLLPRHICVPGLAFATHYQPAEDVAGDVYGVMKLRDNSWVIYIADLVGHGVPAAISATVLKMLIDSTANCTTDPGGILNRVNRLLPQYLADSEFATAAILRWNPEKAELSFASAGHEPVLLMTQHRLVTLDATGIPLGIDPAACWSTTHHVLVPGDRLLLATDGVAETHDPDDKEFSRSRMTEMFNSSHTADIESFATYLKKEIALHRSTASIEDDITFLVAECQVVEKTKYCARRLGNERTPSRND